jgi:alkylhydroperoxidase family enzyme
MGLTEAKIDEGIENYADSDQFTKAEKIALRYSELMGTEPEKIDAAFYEALKRHFSDEEIIELGTFIGFNVGYHTFFGTLDFYPMFSPDGELISQEESRRLYGPRPVSLLRRLHPDTASSVEESKETPLAVEVSKSDEHERKPKDFSIVPSRKPIIEPLSKADITDAGLQKMLQQAEKLRAPDPLFLLIVGRVPSYAKALFRAMCEAHFKGNVDHQLKEIIRIQLARRAGDSYFANLRSQVALSAGLTEARIEAGCGDFANDPQFTPAEKWALRYSYLMYRTPRKLDKAFYDEGKTLFTEAQIMEIGGLIAIHYGMQVFMQTLKVAPLHASGVN